MMHVDCSWFYCVGLVVCRVGWVLSSCFLVGLFLFISGVFLLSVVWFLSLLLFCLLFFVLSSFGVVCVCVPGFFCFFCLLRQRIILNIITGHPQEHNLKAQ